MTYVPLWCKTNFSFLEGASHPDELVRQAAALGLPAIAVTDRDGVYGIVRAHVEAKAVGMRILVGAQISVCQGEPSESRIVLLAQDRAGYANLCGLITTGRMRMPKGESAVTWHQVYEHAQGLLAVWVDGFHRRDLTRSVVDAAHRAFGDRLYIALSRHREATDVSREGRIRARAAACSLPLAAATEVLYHRRERRRLQDVLTCIRHIVPLTEAGTLLRPNAEHELQAPDAFAELYADCPELVARTNEIAERVHFNLDEIVYRYPSEFLPEGYTMAQWLRRLTHDGAEERYPGGVPPEVMAQLHKELDLIDELDYCGYFLTMWDIVQYCKEHSILCQGRGSAANSAVCFCLGITAVDPIRMDLLFERFISRERAEPPDIDLDIAHQRREEVIQHMYEKYGRDRAAMVANVIRYRGKSSVRDIGKVLGISPTAIDRLSALLSHRGSETQTALEEAGLDEEIPNIRLLVELCDEIFDFPRHLSIHPGGFLLGSEPVHTLVPVENGTMPDRTVIQWDKHDVEDMNLFKVDLLGLGALTHLDYCFALLRQHVGKEISMATIPGHDPAVFRMISTGDTVGVFQLESRAQMAMLPRLKPAQFYDIVVEVSIVRPGPITGGMVHPYLRRRNGQEPVTYPHPSLEPVLRKTLGVPLFQEQVMKLAVLAADYTPGEADQLRRDMAAWRKEGRIEQHREKLISRMTKKGIAPAFAEQVFDQIRGFGEYGFPESHAASFALIAYCTAWMKCHCPDVFACGLLNAWPMGFYSPASIVHDARRHGVQVLPIDVLWSSWECTLVPRADAAGKHAGKPRFAIRMGLRFVKELGEEAWERIQAARRVQRASLPEFLSLARLNEEALFTLAQAGGFASFNVDRRTAMWEVIGWTKRNGCRNPGSHRTGRPPSSPAPGSAKADALDLLLTERTPTFDALHPAEAVVWDYETASHSATGHPLESFRQRLRDLGLPDAYGLSRLPDGRKVSYAGLVICRQRPETAGGTLFMTLEDESGFVNLVVWKDTFQRYRSAIITSAFLGVTGTLQSKDGVVHIVVETCWKPPALFHTGDMKSRDFR